MVLESTLPPPEEVILDTRITIVVRRLEEKDATSVSTTFTDTNNNSITGTLWKLSDPKTESYLPSKLWFDNYTKKFTVLYYVSNGLPDSVRPFKNGTYVLVLETDVDEIMYDASIHILIDQIQTPTGTKHVIVFGANSYEHLIDS
jgi:hypothetical protein